MMQQAQELQKKVQKAQEELAEQETTGSAGGGEYVVKITINGKGHVKSCSISDALIDMNEKATLEDLVIAAFNKAKAESDDLANSKMSSLGISPDLLNGFGG